MSYRFQAWQHSLDVWLVLAVRKRAAETDGFWVTRAGEITPAKDSLDFAEIKSLRPCAFQSLPAVARACIRACVQQAQDDDAHQIRLAEYERALRAAHG